MGRQQGVPGFTGVNTRDIQQQAVASNPVVEGSCSQIEPAVPFVPASTTGSIMVSQQKDLLGSEFGEDVKLGGCLGLRPSVPSRT
jgi:hypothetical protein